MIIDLHCDLLWYLSEGNNRKATALEARCSIPQLRKGNISLQTLAVYTQTGHKAQENCRKQFSIFSRLPELYPNDFVHLSKLELPTKNDKIAVISAIENASGLCEEGEHLDLCFSRLDAFQQCGTPVLYISLTWNDENRFGGGNKSSVGIKRDGELLLEYMSGKKIAIDLSHTSDQLAHDILNFIDKKGLKLTPIASHSNFRTIANMPRNLTDELALEIFKRGGIIGLNFVRPFIGKEASDFKRQLDYARHLGGMKQYCFGADFFYFDEHMKKTDPLAPYYFSEFQDATCYPALVSLLGLSDEEQQDMSHKNLASFFARL